MDDNIELYDELRSAVSEGDFEKVKYIVEREHVDVNLPVNEIQPLHVAALEGFLPIVEYLVSKGANVNKIHEDHYDYDYTPLMYAIKGGHVEIAKFLLKQGASTDCDLMKEALGTFGCVKQMIEFVCYNTSCTINQYYQGETLLLRAACQGEIETILHLLDNGADIYKFSEAENQSVLHYATKSAYDTESFEVISDILDKFDYEHFEEAKDFVNHQDSGGRTALHLACHQSKYRSVRVLISWGADPSLRDNEGKRARDLIDPKDKSPQAREALYLTQSQT